MISPLTLGTMEFGSKVSDDQANDLFDAALDSGVNVVDTANVYGGGHSEEMVGRLIARRRDRLLLATKFSVATDETDPNSSGTSRHNVITACEASLKRLQTDHIDIYYVHRPFTQIAIDETLAPWTIWCGPARSDTSACRARRLADRRGVVVRQRPEAQPSGSRAGGLPPCSTAAER